MWGREIRTRPLKNAAGGRSKAYQRGRPCRGFRSIRHYRKHRRKALIQAADKLAEFRKRADGIELDVTDRGEGGIGGC